MTDDLISRKAALEICEHYGAGGEMMASEISALPAANTSALGAVAMKQTAADLVVELARISKAFGDMNSARALLSAADAIDNIPLPTHAAQLAAALALPEVAALQARLDAAEARERQAVEAERERCAVIADESWDYDHENQRSVPHDNSDIAAAIRSGAKP